MKHDGRAVETSVFVAYPESKGNTPVILVIHEIFGMTDWAQEVADEFAAAGYIAVARDLLSGTVRSRTERNQKLFPKAMPSRRSAKFGYRIGSPGGPERRSGLCSEAVGGRARAFVTGFCWGGGRSFRFATSRPDLSAALVFYGPPPDQDAMGPIKAPVYGFYGGSDARIDATIPEAEKNMKAAGKTYEPVVYEGAGHGFMRAGEAPDASEANRKARDEAWQRLKKVLKEH